MRILLFVSGLTFLAMAAFGCGSSPKWTQEQRFTFLASCERGAPNSYCECALEKIEQGWSAEEAAAIAASGSAIPHEWYDIAKECS